MDIDIISAIEGAIVLQGGKALIKGDVYKSISQVLGVVSEESATITRNSFKYFNSVRLAKVFIKVYLKLKKNNVEKPQAIASKILFPTIEHISIDNEIENSENLQNMWANLLANEASGYTVSPYYYDVIKKLDSNDAKVLEQLFERFNNFPDINKTKGSYFHTDDASLIYFNCIPASKDELHRVIVRFNALKQLGLIEGKSQVYLSLLGRYFMRTVTDLNGFNQAH